MRYSFFLACAIITVSALVHASNMENQLTIADRACVGAIIQLDIEHEARAKAIARELYKRLVPTI